ncbi:hypothetical protein RHGRI_036238 [Rhododendron griersonianum]|uniref:Cdc6 C-terminal domain-containing protein n=1 Tax=Rhododendron griersonianum TaxID=479676 RepID=A0AAV6HN77_9ERIC|nr:hypothetical protein RHGRI_036238 [Rhododendron griersonianum]
MPTIAANDLAAFAAGEELKCGIAVKSGRSGETRSNGCASPRKRKLRNESAVEDNQLPTTPPPELRTPRKWKSPRRCMDGSPISPPFGINEGSGKKLAKARTLLVKNFEMCIDTEQLRAVKEALHVSNMPSMVVCREDEQKRVLEFCKQCIEHEKAGSLYVCGCPGTGKSLSIERVKESLLDWAKEAGFQPPDVLAINCTSLTNTPEIFSKILGNNLPQKKAKSATSPLQHLQSLYSQNQQSTSMKMTLIIADELDYLITKDWAVLHDLFMLTTFPFSRCLLIGIANAIDLADRFLPRLQSLNCKPMVLAFRAYTKDQIMKVAAASGDMRKVLCVCRSAIEMLEAELMPSKYNIDLSSGNNGYSDDRITPAIDPIKQEIDVVRVDHMAVALSKTYRSPIVEIIQSLPQHQQIVLCSAVKLFRRGKKDTTIGELSKSYLDICKLTAIPPVGIMDLSSMCRVLGDQGLLKVGQAREDKLRRVSLKVDESDIAFSLQIVAKEITYNSQREGIKCQTDAKKVYRKTHVSCEMRFDPCAIDQSEKFTEAAKHGNLIPLYRSIFSDHLTPGRFSVIGAQPTMEIVAKENMVTVMDHRKGQKTEEFEEDPMVVPRRIMEKWKPQRIDELPEAFCGGWVGYFSYDTVRYVEKKKLPFSSAPRDDRNLPDVHLGLYDDVIVFDHVEKKAYVIHWVRLDEFSSVEEAFNDGMNRLNTLVSRVHDIVPPRLAAGSIKLYTSLFGPSLKNSTMGSEAYKEAVLQAKEHILAGDIFQIVLSQRFERRTFADPFEVYRALRIVNPSPYMTYLQARGCILVASSPEILTRVKKRKVTNRPLAGTVRRGKTPREDYMLEKQLLHDEKQCAEHIMLVDLGRNDVGKVSKPGSVNVEKLMNIERYSHVMHISSTVTGELLDDLSSWDALRAALPVGTVSGAPKDTNRRRDWVAHLQAGAGIVADSDPSDEQRECENKSAALARAIDLAESSFVEK